MICIEGCLLLVVRLNADIVKFLTDIELSEVISFLEFSDQLRDQRERILILNNNHIKNPIVLY